MRGARAPALALPEIQTFERVRIEILEVHSDARPGSSRRTEDPGDAPHDGSFELNPMGVSRQTDLNGPACSSFIGARTAPLATDRPDQQRCHSPAPRPIHALESQMVRLSLHGWA